MMEFVSMAAHNRAMREEVSRYNEQSRIIQTEAIARHFEVAGSVPPIPPVAIAFLITAVRVLLLRESALGSTLGHPEIIAAMEIWLRDLAPAKTSGGRPRAYAFADKEQQPATGGKRRRPTRRRRTGTDK